MPSVTVLYFARAREATGGLVEEAFDAADTDSLRAALIDRHPGLQTVLQSAVLAVNQEYATENLALTDRDEVAVIPPISGG
ncbi:MoaD/ThiS family protein [bacterium]|jgi:molybdopterin synthase catalytic subunit|nr:MoaD/ThiS family protein [bacterium]|tara:strand:- start:3186 stop:3428 length:243 start_codon:yes stop_codon:yes gene_type:complete